MNQGSDYRDRFAEAMRLSGMNEHAIAREVGITYQAVKKVLLGTSGMLKAHHNVMAARAMNVDSEWLATEEGEAARMARPQPQPSSASAPTLDAALPVVLDAMRALTAGQWRMVRARLDDMAGHPEMRDDVAAGCCAVLALIALTRLG